MIPRMPKSQVVVIVHAIIRQATSDTPLIVVFTADATTLYQNLAPAWQQTLIKILSEGPP